MIAHSVAEQLRLIDRAVTVLTRSTEALVRASDEESLLADVCHIAVEVAGYRLAWIGYARADEQRSVLLVAQAGLASEYLQQLRLSWADNDMGRGPTGTAIRTGTPSVVRDTQSDPRFAPWREAAHAHQIRSVIALPLTIGDERIGALTIYADEPDAFDADAIRLLEDVARNLGYGIGALRTKAGHDRAVRALAESEERYRTLVEVSPDAVIVHAHGTILFANAASAGAFGAFDAATLVGRSLLDLVHPSSRDTVAPCIAAPSEGRTQHECQLMRLDGTPFQAEVVATSVAFHGLSARLLVVRDITQRVQVQEQLVQSAKLATLGEIAAGLVHELSQPLNIIRLTAEGALLFIERGKSTQEWQAQQFQLIADQSQRTAEIIDDIRIFSRRDNSPEQVFDAVAAVRAAIGVLGSQMRPDDIVLVADLPDRPLPVRGRRVQLEQVVMNLLSNAHHALKEKRERGAEAGWSGMVRVSAAVTGRELRITVADNGPGIPAAVRSRVFEPFFTTKEAGRGTGLGLSVSFGIITAMGGRLEVAEAGEGGACFVISLPLDADARPTAAPPPSPLPLPPAADAHIMVVEDDVTAGETLARYLRELGYRITVCSSGSQAWERFAPDPADVVITDLRMPSGGGEQLVEKLRDFDPLLPIIIVTGHLGATERLSDVLQDDRCAVLKKPVALGRLGKLIAGFLRPPE